MAGRWLQGCLYDRRNNPILVTTAEAPQGRARCAWASTPTLARYHDEEWGVPVTQDRLMFEHVVLDGFQAGLSWAIILNKREGFRRAFDGFDARKIAAYGPDDVKRLRADASIVRNRLKIEATIGNAQAFLKIVEAGGEGSFCDLIWRSTGGKVRHNAWPSLNEVPATTPESDALSRELKKRGFRFVGSTICYAFMQAAGLVNDHETRCFRHAQLKNR